MTVATLSRISTEEDIEETLCNKLWQFRLSFEGQADQSLAAMNVPFALLMSDLCVFAGLSEQQHDRVLGEKNVCYINEMLATRWRLKTSGN